MTVCMVLNGRPGPSAETRAHVLALAKKLNYSPPASSRMFRRPEVAHSGLVAILVPPVQDNRLQAIVRQVQANYRVSLVLEVTSVSDGLGLARAYRPDLVINLLASHLHNGDLASTHNVYEAGPRKTGAVLALELAKVLAKLPPVPQPVHLMT